MDPLTQTPQPYQPSPMTPSNNRGLMVASIVGAVLLVLVVATYVASIWPFSKSEIATVSPSPSTDSTASWKTYTNTQYGFEFKYPAEWTTTSSLNSEFGNDYYYVQLFRNNSPGNAPAISISIAQDKYNSNIRTYLTNYQVQQFIEETSIGGKPAYTVQGVTPPTAHDFRVVFTNGNVYLISSRAPSVTNLADRPKIELVFGQIISTFKFTGSTSSVPADWKTYTNTRYGFEFKYPIETESPGSLVFTADSPAGCQNTVGGKCNNPSRYIYRVAHCFSLGGLQCDSESSFSVEVFSNLTEFAGVKSRWNTGSSAGNSMSDAQIGGVSGQKVIYAVSRTQDSVYFVVRGSYGFLIQAHDVLDQKNIPTDEMRRILSTFKFTQ